MDQERESKRRPPDPELAAIRRMMDLLEEFPPTARDRILSYVLHRVDQPKEPKRQLEILGPPIEGERAASET
jgi:hypothetical protein